MRELLRWHGAVCRCGRLLLVGLCLASVSVQGHEHPEAVGRSPAACPAVIDTVQAAKMADVPRR